MAVGILGEGKCEAGLVTGGVVVIGEALHPVPAIVLATTTAGSLEINLLIHSLPHLSEVEVAGAV